MCQVFIINIAVVSYQESSLPLHGKRVESRYLNNEASYKGHSSVQDRMTKGSLEDVPNPLSLHVHASVEGSPKHTLPSSLHIKSSDIRILDVIGQGI